MYARESPTCAIDIVVSSVNPTPTAFTSIRSSPFLEKGEPLSRLGASLTQFGEGILNLEVFRIPLRGLFEVALRFGRQSGAFAEQAGVLEEDGVGRLALHG